MEKDDDYTLELVSRWATELAHVAKKDKVKVAQRLEYAHRRTLGPNGDRDALDKELADLMWQGLLGR